MSESTLDRRAEQAAAEIAPPPRRGRAQGVLDWLDERLGIRATILPLVTHPVPRGLGWSYVLGSAVLVAFIIQVATGVALSMSYIPSTNDAYASLQFITHEAPLGRLIRGLHFFGAGAMVTLVFAHLAQVFLIGAYKYPRELNWISGSLLLLFTLALAFTGQLLRWEQNAYWSIVVAVQQVGKAPLVGNALMQLVLAGWTVGPATLSRFYATHVFLLPAAVFLFVAVHLYLVYRIGISEPPRPGRLVDPRTYTAFYHRLLERDGEPFFPNSFLRDATAAVVLMAVVLALALVVGPPELGEPADPTLVHAYPRPDWYFLWYFAMLALLPEFSETLFILGFPVLVGMVLLALPFIANRGERAPSRRPWAIAAVALTFTLFVALTYAGIRSPWSPLLQPTQVQLPPQVLQGLTPEQQRGAQVYQSYGCPACHAIGGVGGSVGPSLDGVADRYERGELIITILRGRGKMPAFSGALSPEELNDLVAFLETLGRRGRA